MIKEMYERMLAKYGPENPGTINAKRQLDAQTKVVQGKQAMEDDKRSQGLIIVQTIPKAPPPTPKTKNSSNEDKNQD